MSMPLRSAKVARFFRRLLMAAAAGIVLAWLPAAGAVAAQPVLTDATAPVAPDTSGHLPAGWVNTQWGPYGPADALLLQNVRLANLWEGRGAAPMALKKSSTKRVKEVGQVLIDQHVLLETKLVKIAGQLGVALPTQPNNDQASWLKEMTAASGPAFDQVWVDRLRAAHGKIFSLIATVRANTRNSLVREFAAAGNDIVSNHMQLLESTGLVKYNEQPTPNVPVTTAPGPFSEVASVQVRGPGETVLWVVLAGALLVGGTVAYRMLRPRRGALGR
jgi:predicted outer membrane protein